MAQTTNYIAQSGRDFNPDEWEQPRTTKGAGTSPRKRHNREAGYVAERMNPYVPDTKVVIYEAEAQGMDTNGECYAIVCDAHGSIVGDSSLKGARLFMKAPCNFCEECAALRHGPVKEL